MFLSRLRRPPQSTLFPTRRSSDLVRQERRYKPTEVAAATGVDKRTVSREIVRGHLRSIRVGTRYWAVPESDRKSTRLNSSHSQISYAVFCLKKKKELISTLAQIPS